MIQIKLDVEQMRYGCQVGCDRLILNLNRRYADRAGEPSWNSHIEGALGEIAACLALGVDYHVVALSRWGQPDIPPDWDVRTSKFEGSVRVKKTDPDNRKIICVSGFGGNYRVWGWCWAKDAKESGVWRNTRFPGWFLSCEELSQFVPGV